MSADQTRRDKVDRVHGALGHGLEDLFDLLLAGHVMTQQLDAELWRRFREKLERHRRHTLLWGHEDQDAFDPRGDLLEDLKPLAGERARVARNAGQIVLR